MPEAREFVLIVWWGAPAALMLGWLTMRQPVGWKLAALTLTALVGVGLYFMIESNESSTAGIGYLTLAPLVWVTPLICYIVWRWRAR